MTQASVYPSTVPDTRPSVVAGTGQNDLVDALIQSADVCHEVGGLGHAELVFNNTARKTQSGIDYAFETPAGSPLDLGARLSVAMGDRRNAIPVFVGIISALVFEHVEGVQAQLRVMAEDALMPLRMRRRNRTYDAGTLGSVLSGCASAAGLRADASTLSDEVSAQQQTNETDLSFLRRLCERYDADPQVSADGTLTIRKRGTQEAGTVTLTLGENLRTVRVTADIAHQRAETALFGFDVGAGRTEAVRATGDDLGAGSGTTGAQTLARIFSGTRDVLPSAAFQNATEAERVAAAAQRRRARSFVIAEGQATGDPRIKVGTVLTIQKVGPRFKNDYTVTRVRHHYDKEGEGYLTDFTAECAYWGPAQ